MTTAIISALTGIAVHHEVAMTGEITLRGRVLPIGGLKEKVFAAYRAGIKTIIIPKDNEKDLEEIPENIRSKIKFVMANTMEDVLSVALTKNVFTHDVVEKSVVEFSGTTEYHHVEMVEQ